MTYTIHFRQGAVQRVGKGLFDAYVSRDKAAAESKRPGVGPAIAWAEDESGRVVFGERPEAAPSPAGKGRGKPAKAEDESGKGEG